jgi:UDP-N-acetyl-D-glucosamine dehydrogenase
LLGARGAVCTYTDPLVPTIPRTREHADLAGMTSLTITAETLAQTDAVLLATDHTALDYALIAAHAPLIIDTRNAFARRGLTGGNIVKA